MISIKIWLCNPTCESTHTHAHTHTHTHALCALFSPELPLRSFSCLCVSQLFMQIDALYPKRFGTWTDYAKKYCNAHYRSVFSTHTHTHTHTHWQTPCTNIYQPIFYYVSWDSYSFDIVAFNCAFYTRPYASYPASVWSDCCARPL